MRNVLRTNTELYGEVCGKLRAKGYSSAQAVRIARRHYYLIRAFRDDDVSAQSVANVIDQTERGSFGGSPGDLGPVAGEQEKAATP